MSAPPPSYLTVSVEPDPGFTLNLDHLAAEEQLGRPFLITLDLSSPKSKGDLLSMLGSSVTVKASQPTGDPRYYNGIVARMSYTGLSGGTYRYRMELRPWIWLLSHTRDCAMFQNQSVWATITGLFSKMQFSDFEDHRKNNAGSTVLEYCVQYRETALDFVTRLMEQYGIYYYFLHKDGHHILALADDPGSHQAMKTELPYGLRQTDQRAVADHVWDVSAELALQSGAYTHRDYNFTTPSADVSGKQVQPGQHAHGTLEVFDYPAVFTTPADGAALAAIRMQDLAARRKTVSATTNARGLYAGCKVRFKNLTDNSLNGEYLVVSASSSFSIAEGLSDTGGEMSDTYRCTFHAIPGDTPFRLPLQTPRPIVQGPQSAKVVGNSGEEITTDQYGRIKVQFYWDRVGQNDQNSSCWIRVSQAWAGSGWGSMVIPRIGQEVIVDFLEGNPDRPIVTGRVYNASQMPPYKLPDKMNVSSMMSNSTKGGGGSNEFRMDDTKGSEEVFLHAQYNYTKKVENNEAVTVVKDTATTVTQGKRTVEVQQGDNTLTISQGKNTATVSVGDDTLTVSQGNHSIMVSAGKSSITAGQSITLTVGANSITIDTSGVTISAAKFTVSAEGQASVQSGAAMSLQSGAAMSINSAAAMAINGLTVAIND